MTGIQEPSNPVPVLTFDESLEEVPDQIPEQKIVASLVELGHATNLGAISFSIENEITSIKLRMDGEVAYSAYIQEEPYGLVLELDDVRIPDDVSVAPPHPYLNSIAYGNDEGEHVLISFTSILPIQIDDAQVTNVDDAYLLTVRVHPIEEDPHVPVVQETVEPAGEVSIAGQMEIIPSTAGPDNSLDRAMSEARKLYSQKRYQAADSLIIEIINKHPLNIDARTLYASTLITRNQIGLAIQVLGSGLSLQPGVSQWAKIYARLLIERGQTDRAIEAMEQALPEITEDLDYHAMYAALLQQESRHTLAIETYQSLLRHKPDNSIWWMGLAISQDAVNDSANALYSYNMALKGQSMDFELRKFILEQIQRLSD